MSIISTTTGQRLIAVTALAFGLTFGATAQAAPGPDGLTTCQDIDELGQPQCDPPDDPGFEPPGGFQTPPADPDPDPDPEPDPEPEIPDAPVDDPVVATPTFTG